MLIFNWILIELITKISYKIQQQHIQMIKEVLLFVLVLQVLSVQRKARLNYNDEIVLHGINQGNFINVTIESLPGNDASVPITVSLREIKDLANPLGSSQLASLTCTFDKTNCTANFTTVSINSTYKYAIRLAESSTLHNVDVRVKYSTSFTQKIGKNQKKFTRVERADGRIFLTPEGATSPGFKFYASKAGTWAVQFKVVSYPAPTVSSFDLTLWNLNGVQLTSDLTQSASKGGSANFNVASAGFYYLSFGLKIQKIDAKTRYPIILQFTYNDDVCPSGDYFDRKKGSCEACSNDANSNGLTTAIGVCDCNEKFFWNQGLQQCVACPTKGCPSANKFNQVNVPSNNHEQIPANNNQKLPPNDHNNFQSNNKNANNPSNLSLPPKVDNKPNNKENNQAKQEYNRKFEGLQILIQDFNKGNLRSNYHNNAQKTNDNNKNQQAKPSVTILPPAPASSSNSPNPSSSTSTAAPVSSNIGGN